MGKYDDAALGARASASAPDANYDRVLAAVAAELQLVEEKFSQEGKEAAEALRLAGVEPVRRTMSDTKLTWRLKLAVLSGYYNDVDLILNVDGEWPQNSRRHIEKERSLGKPAVELALNLRKVVDILSANLDANGRFEPDTLLPTAISNLGVVNGEFVIYEQYPAPLITLEEGIRAGIAKLIARGSSW